MRLPIFNELPAAKEMTEEFGGYNHNLRIPNSDWYDQKNMTLDYYPMASVRKKRDYRVISEKPITFTYGGNTYTIDGEVIGAVQHNDKLVTLHQVMLGTTRVGLWFLINGSLLGRNYPAEIVEKMTYFNYTSAANRNIVKMASYICVLPDGVGYESANTTDNVPVFAVKENVAVSQDVVISTAIEDKSYQTGYWPIRIDQASYPDKRFAYNNETIQHYLLEEAMWVNQPTCLVMFVPNATGTFGRFKENDVVTITYDSLSNGYGQSVSMDYVNGIFTNKEARAKIIKKGVIDASVPSGWALTNDTEYIVVEGFICASYTNSGTLVKQCQVNATDINLERKMPVISDIAFVAQNRLWCCDKLGHEYYASALDNPYNFYDFSHLSTDSFAQNVLTDGTWTGGASYNDTPIFFKENAAHVVQGYYPINDGVQDGNSYSDRAMTDFRGCEQGSSKSFAIIDNILYYKSKDGVVAFDGANTVLISDVFGNIRYNDAVAGSTSGKYYISMRDNNDARHLFVYDTKKGMWSKEDNLAAKFAFKYNDWLGFIAPIEIDGNTSDIRCYVNVSDEYEPNEEEFAQRDWMCETGTYGYSYPNNKYVSRFQIRLQIAADATASVYIQYDSDGVWHKKGEFSNKGTKTYLLPIVPQRCDHMKLKFEGKGDVKIISIAKILEEGGDV